jgi:hypothetical protein
LYQQLNAAMSGMNELDLILQNARLRDELEPYHDESLDAVNVNGMTTADENRYLSSLLAWERAPVLPVSQWFSPELVLPLHTKLDDEQLAAKLLETIKLLASQNVILESTGHLSDRQLYCLIQRDILPSQEKRLAPAESQLVWQCLDQERDEESWLRYYASESERDQWWLETGLRLPPRQDLPFPR